MTGLLAILTLVAQGFCAAVLFHEIATRGVIRIDASPGEDVDGWAKWLMLALFLVPALLAFLVLFGAHCPPEGVTL